MHVSCSGPERPHQLSFGCRVGLLFHAARCRRVTKVQEPQVPAMQDALTRNLARQYAPHSVRVIGVNPAWVDTEAPAAMATTLQVRLPL